MSEKKFPPDVLLQNTNSQKIFNKGNQFVCVQCEIEVFENLKNNFANFAPIFKKTLVSKNDIGFSMKIYVEEGRVLSQHPKMLISSFTF